MNIYFFNFNVFYDVSLLPNKFKYSLSIVLFDIIVAINDSRDVDGRNKMNVGPLSDNKGRLLELNLHKTNYFGKANQRM